MNPTITGSDLAQIISLAVAPVFLLAGIAGFLNVMSGRLGRIIDRARVVAAMSPPSSQPGSDDIARRELRILWRRASITHKSIALCTGSALLVCLVIVGLFIEGFWALRLSSVIVVLFAMALVLLVASLLLFLKEIQLATRTLRLGRETAPERPPGVSRGR
ncbi:MAG: DUF2721 domain-containing protein [Chromatocurvus sp.]